MPNLGWCLFYYKIWRKCDQKIIIWKKNIAAQSCTQKHYIRENLMLLLLILLRQRYSNFKYLIKPQKLYMRHQFRLFYVQIYFLLILLILLLLLQIQCKKNELHAIFTTAVYWKCIMFNGWIPLAQLRNS